MTMEQYLSIQQIFMSIWYLLGSGTVRKGPIGAETRETKGKMGSVEVEGGGWGYFGTIESKRTWQFFFSSRNYEKTLEESSISVTGSDLHIDQITPAAFESPEPVGCHREHITAFSQVTRDIIEEK